MSVNSTSIVMVMVVAGQSHHSFDETKRKCSEGAFSAKVSNFLDLFFLSYFFVLRVQILNREYPGAKPCKRESPGYDFSPPAIIDKFHLPVGR